ncbi:MAG: BTAD domain-containing putative transcriptional regulator [Kibdelosporangium sp.]
MEFILLGPMEAWHEGAPVPLGGPQRRCVLALLLLQPGRVVPLDRLAEIVWGDAPPAKVRSAVRMHVSRLRKALAGDPEVVVGARHSGYVVDIDPQRVDLHRFRRLVADARAGTDSSRSRRLLGEALRLWRGKPLAGLVGEEPRKRLCGGLDEERMSALEQRIELDLQTGRHNAVIAELTQLAADHPARERLAELRMLALYRCGRPTEALAAYQQIRAHLVEEFGIEPGEALRSLQGEVLNADRSWSAPAVGLGEPRLPIPRQLPADVASFTGRGKLLKELDHLHPAVGDRGATPVVIAAIAGMAGVGKSALGVHWAQQVRDEFPDGQLYVNLRGCAAGPPMRPIEALTHFLRALGAPAHHIPTEVETAAGLYRSLLSDKRVLVMLDNASHAEQVRPLLPGSTTCRVLVTSRDMLTDLVARHGARRLVLDVLTRQEAASLITRILGADRASAEPDAVAELARVCARLPLALRIAVANLADRPHDTIAGYVAGLCAGSKRLDALRIEAELVAAGTVFEPPHRCLPPDVQRVFRLSGCETGPRAAAMKSRYHW